MVVFSVVCAKDGEPIEDEMQMEGSEKVGHIVSKRLAGGRHSPLTMDFVGGEMMLSEPVVETSSYL